MKKSVKARRAARPKRSVRVKKSRKTRKPPRAVPSGFHTLTPQLTVRGADQAIDFYTRAFGATEQLRMSGPDGRTIMHAEIKIGDSVVFLADESPGMGARSPDSLGGTTASLHVYVRDVDAAFQRAVAAGAQVRMPVADMFWGDRYARVADPFGHEWGIATHKEDLTPAKLRERADAFFARMGQP